MQGRMLGCAAAALLATAAAVRAPIRPVRGPAVSRAAAPAMVFDQLKKMVDDSAKGVRCMVTAHSACWEIWSPGGDASHLEQAERVEWERVGFSASVQWVGRARESKLAIPEPSRHGRKRRPQLPRCRTVRSGRKPRGQLPTQRMRKWTRPHLDIPG
jgi:hypothetical protein